MVGDDTLLVSTDVRGLHATPFIGSHGADVKSPHPRGQPRQSCATRSPPRLLLLKWRCLNVNADTQRPRRRSAGSEPGADNQWQEPATPVYGQGEGAERLIIGGGQYGRVELSAEAAEYLARKRREVVLVPTPEVIASWNEAKGRVIGLFHVTC